MIKKIVIVLVVVLLVVAAIYGVMSLSPRYAGVSHLTGLDVGVDGFSSGYTTALTGTTTISKSYDGFVAWDDFTVSTGTAKMVYTNSTGVDMMCDADSGMLYADATGFAPAIVAAFGTTTSATGYSDNLLSSTTLATSSDSLIALTYTVPFLLASGNSIVGAISDASTDASSTYFSNWSIQSGVHCWLMGQ